MRMPTHVFAILTLIDSYGIRGFEIGQLYENLTNKNLLGGTLYTTLKRLREKGLIQRDQRLYYKTKKGYQAEATSRVGLHLLTSSGMSL